LIIISSDPSSSSQAASLEEAIWLPFGFHRKFNPRSLSDFEIVSIPSSSSSSTSSKKEKKEEKLGDVHLRGLGCS
jgi:hypothetical protein